MNISIVGNGNMAKGIGTRLIAGGHAVNLHAHTAEKGEALAKELGGGATVKELGSQLDDVVVLAVGYDAIDDVVKEYEGQWDSKTVIDITNPVDFATFQLIPAPGTAGAEEIAKKLSGAKVVKAFNTAFAHTLVAGEVSGQPLDIFIAGDDEDAKKTISQLITDGKMRAIDAGGLANARHLEGFALIHMAIQTPMDLGFSSAIKVLS
jgi:predicted dinucleotide-binding enzyme